MSITGKTKSDERRKALDVIEDNLQDRVFMSAVRRLVEQSDLISQSNDRWVD